MRDIPTDVPRSLVCLSVSLSVCLLVTFVSCAKTAEPIGPIFAVEAGLDYRSIVLNFGPDSKSGCGVIGENRGISSGGGGK